MEWVSVERKLPENGTPVLIAAGHYVTLASWNSDEKRFQFTSREDAALISSNDITHWMPLPEPPKERHKG